MAKSSGGTGRAVKSTSSDLGDIPRISTRRTSRPTGADILKERSEAKAARSASRRAKRLNRMGIT